MQCYVFCLLVEDTIKNNLLVKFFKELSVKVRRSTDTSLPENFNIHYADDIDHLLQQLKKIDCDSEITIVHNWYFSENLINLRNQGWLGDKCYLVQLMFHRNEGDSGIFYSADIRKAHKDDELSPIAKKIVSLNTSTFSDI